MNNSDKVKQQISPSIKTNWSEVTHDSRVFLKFRDCLQLFWTDLAVFYCVYCKYFPHRSWAEKKRVELRRKQIKRRWKFLQAREGKHFGEVCLWTQLKIIIVKKKHKLTVQGLSRLKAPSPLPRGEKLLLLQHWTLLLLLLFCVLSRCLPLMTYTDLCVSPSAYLRSVFGFVGDSIEKQGSVGTLFMWYFVFKYFTQHVRSRGKEQRKYLCMLMSLQSGCNSESSTWFCLHQKLVDTFKFKNEASCLKK